jgi:2-phospho-L-lactate guanylyltransferase
VIRIVVPYAGARGKTRLGDAREDLSHAMLEAVLAAANEVGATWVVSPDPVERATWIPDPGGGQGAAVEAALAEIGPGPVLIVNSDLPSATADDLRALYDAIPEGGMAIAEARDGTTNALGLSDTSLFAPLYGPGSAERFRAHAEQFVDVIRAGLRDDVDTPADLATA